MSKTNQTFWQWLMSIRIVIEWLFVVEIIIGGIMIGYGIGTIIAEHKYWWFAVIAGCALLIAHGCWELDRRADDE